MANFSSLWDNPLLIPSILKASRENKSEFAQKAQGRLEQNPPAGAQFTPLIAASRAALDLFVTAKDGTSLGLQKAATQRLDAMLPTIRSTGEVLEGALKFNFESDPAVITEFFPQGRTAVSTAKRGDVLSILNNWVDRATERQAVLGATWVTRLTALRTQWTTNLDAQSGNISRVAGARSDIESAWETLSWSFYDIAMQLALANPRNAAVADVYFDFSVFNLGSSTATDGNSFLKVQVRSRFDKTPLANCKIIFADANGQEIERATTDLEGRYTSPAVPPGFYQLTAAQPDYVTQTNTFQTFDEKTEEQIIELGTA
jgi:hypothetical protein